MATNGVVSNQDQHQNQTHSSNSQNNTRTTAPAKPAPTGPAPPVPSPAPTSAPPNPPTVPPANLVNGANSHTSQHHSQLNSASQKQSLHHAQQQAQKKKPDIVDPVAMYETVRNRIAALEEEEVHGEEEERKIVEEARRSVKGMSDSAVHTKYIDLYQEFKRMERDHAKERQKLVKDKDNGTRLLPSSSPTANSHATKEPVDKIQSKQDSYTIGYKPSSQENKKLREDSRALAINVKEAQDEILNLKVEMERRADKAKKKEKKFLESPDIVIKVVCKYRAELFFKISRKTKLSRLFNAWTERMEGVGSANQNVASNLGSTFAGSKKDPAVDGQDGGRTPRPMTFIFTFMGRTIEPDQTPEDAGMDDGDEILAVEMMDLTTDDCEEVPEPQRQRLKKNWTENTHEAKQALEEIFDAVVRERLKDFLRQYELREKHFDCIIRSKELEVLLSRARAEEQRNLVEQERRKAAENEAKTRELNEEAQQLKEQSSQIHSQLQRLKEQSRDINTSQARLLEDLRACCEAPTPERTQRLFMRLREELERRGAKLPEINVSITAGSTSNSNGVTASSAGNGKGG
ncbi:hypothetical protein Clacol_007631 [Clathrus columnatus]|uniref:Ubiquitin-like domain-containing protein n=1 Tax=Clathrus columnatus TaxID=1419009 RepID=A0AAV5AFF9_9AGAM|nr:hypothetical protein Clacol_007631 [Clathrus columnatus]